MLYCGIISSLLYVVANIITVLLYKGYSPINQTVSELSAIGAPTRPLWVALLSVYSMLVLAFGLGIWQSGTNNRPLRIMSILLLTDTVIGVFWPPMHQRPVLAAGGGTISDTLHIAFTMITVPLMMLIIIFGAAAMGKVFRLYSVSTLVVLITAGIITGIDAPNIQKNLPTPWIGVWERINIASYMLWVIVFTMALLQKEKQTTSATQKERSTQRKHVA